MCSPWGKKRGELKVKSLDASRKKTPLVFLAKRRARDSAHLGACETFILFVFLFMFAFLNVVIRIACRYGLTIFFNLNIITVFLFKKRVDV